MFVCCAMCVDPSKPKTIKNSAPHIRKTRNDLENSSRWGSAPDGSQMFTYIPHPATWASEKNGGGRRFPDAKFLWCWKSFTYIKMGHFCWDRYVGQ